MPAGYNPDLPPSSKNLGGPCPRCGRVSSFTRVDTTALSPAVPIPGLGIREWATILQCQGCHDAIVVVERRNAQGIDAPVSTWPPLGSGTTDESVPATVGDMYGEAVRCLSVSAPHGAVAMLRSALAQVVQDKGSEAAKGKRSLRDAVKQMVADGALWPTFGEWADHIRETGNAGAHPEVFGVVTMEEANDLRALVEQLLEILYVTPAQITRARAARGGGAPA